MTSFLAGAGALGLGLSVAALSVDRFALAAFAVSLMPLVLLAVVRDYGPRPRRFEPRGRVRIIGTALQAQLAASAANRSVRLPLAA